jgi:hypothetical protein
LRVGGRNVGDILILEGLAKPFRCGKRRSLQWKPTLRAITADYDAPTFRCSYRLQTDGLCEMRYFFRSEPDGRGFFSGWLSASLAQMLRWIGLRISLGHASENRPVCAASQSFARVCATHGTTVLHSRIVTHSQPERKRLNMNTLEIRELSNAELDDVSGGFSLGFLYGVAAGYALHWILN